MSKRAFYLTTPIFYPNDKLHLGHAYCLTIADIIVRYKKIQGYQVHLQTGSDDHGEKIEKKALSLGISPQELVDKNVFLFQQLWKELGISEHIFYRTSSPFHKEKVQKTFTKLLEKGDIYLGEYQGKYCVACEDYVSESKIISNNLCPNSDCQTELRKINEPAYFLKVSKYYSRLKEHYRQNPGFLLPGKAKKELFSNFLNENVPDLCITQKGESAEEAAKREVFEETSLVIEDLEKIGEENFYANNICRRLPSKILAHGWLTTSQGKMSKSKGNVVDPLELLKKYSKDPLRAYFVAKISFLKDGSFSEDLLKEFYQDFFIHNLGNLCQRVGKMIELYNDSVIPAFAETKNTHLKNYYQNCLTIIKNYQQKMDNYQLTNAFQEVEKLLNVSNKLIQEVEP
ncbi:3476_t:CDS:2 [Entrophospora sp. SA101]|nr:3476_t:CDS:2 [Entrophospora sp. SA101]